MFDCASATDLAGRPRERGQQMFTDPEDKERFPE